MKNIFSTLCFLVCALTTTAVLLFGSHSTAAPAPPTWEYKFEYKCNEKRANNLAVEGWELITYSTTYLSAGAGSLDTCVFKKQKS